MTQTSHPDQKRRKTAKAMGLFVERASGRPMPMPTSTNMRPVVCKGEAWRFVSTYRYLLLLTGQGSSPSRAGDDVFQIIGGEIATARRTGYSPRGYDSCVSRPSPASSRGRCQHDSPQPKSEVTRIEGGMRARFSRSIACLARDPF